VSGERVATDMLAAESVKLRSIMTGPGASVEAVESELRRWVVYWYNQPLRLAEWRSLPYCAISMCWLAGCCSLYAATCTM
jgi:hypothetical protein